MSTDDCATTRKRKRGDRNRESEADSEEDVDDHRSFTKKPKKTYYPRVLPYHGEVKCATCSNPAYWALKDVTDDVFLCGVHSRKYDHGGRIALPKRSSVELAKIKDVKLAEAAEKISAKTAENKAAGRRGTVTLYRMRMMHNPPDMPGVLKVFPNFKHQNRRDGFGCMRLSPKFLGPVNHGQPGLPPAKNIENFHQGSKCFREETIVGTDDPSLLYYENRLRFYEDPVPHRHKYKGQGANKNVPLYFIWVDKEGKEHRLSYVASRQFYCSFYERLASKEADYAELVRKLDDGIDLCICGFDAIPLRPDETIEDAYLDDSKPFGHELVLYAMLTASRECTGKEILMPWKKYKSFDFI